MVEHYGNVKGNLQAGAVTYFAFLSFFPVLALGFFVVGWMSAVFPGAEDALSGALESLLPGIFGTDEGELSAETFQQGGTGLARDRQPRSACCTPASAGCRRCAMP